MASWGRAVKRVYLRGDSITYGYAGAGLPSPPDLSDATCTGWREGVDVATRLTHTLCGPNTNSAQSLQSGSATMSSKCHNGHSGQSAETVKALIAAEVAAQPYHLMVLALGVNDILGLGHTAFATLNDVDACIVAACGVNPALVVGVCTLTPLSHADSNTRRQQFNAGLDARVTAHVAAGRPVSAINVGEPTLVDGVHPTQDAAGYEVMAAAITAWLQAHP